MVRTGPRRWWALLGSSLGTATLLTGCAPSAPPDARADDSPVSTLSQDTDRVVTPPAGRGLQPVGLPDVSLMEPTVRQQMELAFNGLIDAIDDDASASALGSAYGELGRLLMAASHLQVAETSFRNAETLAPDDRRWPYYLGQIYRVIGPLDQAVSAFERVLALTPDDPATLVWLGEVHLTDGRPDAAAPYFERALQRSPGSSAAHFGAGRVALAQEDYTTAARELERALAAAPEATSIHYSLALAYRGLDDPERAEDHLARRGEAEPRPNDPLMRELDGLLESAESYDMRGGQAMEEGNWAAAAELFRRGLEIAPDNTSLRHRLGTVLAQLGDVRGAEEQFTEVVRRSPEHSRAQFSLGVLMAAGGRLVEAASRFETAVEHDPVYLRARLELAHVLAQIGRPDDSLQQYARVLELDSTVGEAMLGRAMALVRLHRYREARDALDHGHSTFPEQPVFAHALARLLAAAPDERVRDGRRARDLVEGLLEQTQSLDLGETVAMALAELGEYQQAAAVQRDLISVASESGLDEAVARMRVNLELYERGEPCRTPWTESELP